MAILLGLLLLLLGVFFQQCSGLTCKVTPSSPNWPSTAQWQALNASVQGRLIQPVPPGAVCHSNFPQYNAAACSTVASQWSNSAWHLTQSVTGTYNDDTCRPSSSLPCSSSGYPAYVVAAQSAADVQAAVKFAASTGVRLVVRGTGHDFPGRSQGPGALSIWTHNIRGMTFNSGGSRLFNNATGTATIMAGHTVSEVLEAAGQNSVTVVTGSDPTVGVGGVIASGGHGPVSNLYGLVADNVIEMQVVTAAGELKTINTQSEPDLFWAWRGGGGSTFGVMISATVLTYPNLPAVYMAPLWTTRAESDTFWNLLTTMTQMIPQFSKNGLSGYFYSSATDANDNSHATIRGGLLVTGKTVVEAQAIFDPLLAAIKAANWPDPITMTNTTVALDSYCTSWGQHSPEGVGFDGRLSSRLFDLPALTGDFNALKSTLQAATPIHNREIISHLVTQPGVASINVPGGNAVLPAWRNTWAHFVVTAIWEPVNAAAKTAETTALKANTLAFKNHAPNTGAYLPESDPSEVDWQNQYYGSNYARLLSIKNRYDPNGVFWCIPCVGHEQWTVTGADGIGQDGGTICKA